MVLSLEMSSSRRAVAVADLATEAAAQEITLEQTAEVRHTAVFNLIEQALGKAGNRSKRDVSRLAIGLGPGSYTGIRVAISTAQGWAAGRPVELVGVPAIRVLQEQLRRSEFQGPVLLAFDAQRGELYAARGVVTREGATLDHPLRLMSVEEAWQHQQSGTPVMGPDLGRLVPQSIPLFPSASILAELARTSREFLAPESLEPVYLRETTFVKISPPSSIEPTGERRRL